MRLRFLYYPAQYAFITLPTFIKAMVAGVRAGKSWAVCMRAIEFCYMHAGMKDMYGAITSPTLPNADKSIVPTMRRVLGELGLREGVHWNIRKSSPKSFEIFGVTIWIQSGARPEYLAGPTLGWAAIDEPFVQDEYVFSIMLARVSDPRSRMRELLLSGTPEQLNWGYDLCVGKGHDDVSYVQCPSESNPSCPKDVIAVMRRTFDTTTARAMLGGEFVMKGSTRAYTMFTDDCIRETAEYNPQLPLVLCCDFNRAPMCWNVQHEPLNTLDIGDRRVPWNDTHVVDELHIDGTSTRDAAEAFVLKYGRRGLRHGGPVIVTGDYSGTAHHTNSDTTDYTELMATLEREWGTNGVELQLTTNPTQRARINITNAELLSHSGERHMFVHPRCTYTIRDYQNACMAKGTTKLDKKRYDPHHADACDYRVHYKVSTVLAALAA